MQESCLCTVRSTLPECVRIERHGKGAIQCIREDRFERQGTQQLSAECRHAAADGLRLIDHDIFVVRAGQDEYGAPLQIGLCKKPRRLRLLTAHDIHIAHRFRRQRLGRRIADAGDEVDRLRTDGGQIAFLHRRGQRIQSDRRRHVGDLTKPDIACQHPRCEDELDLLRYDTGTLRCRPHGIAHSGDELMIVAVDRRISYPHSRLCLP